jgi:hypothetical protein
VIFAAAVAFAIAVLMYAFSLSSGHVDWILFALIGLLCMALSGCGWGWLTVRRPAPPQPPSQP